MKRLLSLFLTIVIAFGTFACLPTTASAASMQTLVPDEELNFTWSDDTVYGYITVEESGYYDITLSGTFGYGDYYFCTIFAENLYNYWVGRASKYDIIDELPYTFKNLYLEEGIQYILNMACVDTDYDYCSGNINLLLTKNDYVATEITSDKKLVVADENELQWFTFETEESGDYWFNFGDDAYAYILDYDTNKIITYVGTGEYFGTVRLEGNTKYKLRVSYYNTNPQPMYVSFGMHDKTVDKVELYNGYCYAQGSLKPENFNYKVTYTDGTTEVVGYSFFENRGIYFDLYYTGKYSDSEENYRSPGKQKVEINYGSKVYESYIDVLTFLEFVSDLKPAYPYTSNLSIQYEDAEYKQYFWRVKIDKTGTYSLFSHDAWNSTFKWYHIEFFDKDNNIVPYNNGWLLKSGQEYCLMMEYYYDDYVTWDFNFTIEIDPDAPTYKPSTPKLNSVSRTSSGVKVSWSEAKYADKYIVYRKTAKGSWTKLGTTTSTSFTDTKAKTGTTYYYTVKAQNDYGTSGYNKTGLKIKYVAPPKLTSIANESSGVRVKWSKVSGADGYYLYRRVSGTTSWSKIATIKKGSTTSYLDKKASAGKTYEYIIKCYDGSTPSASAAKAIKIKRLTVPKLVSAKSAKAGVTVKWGKVAGAEGYLVYRKTGKSSWSQVGKVEGNSTFSYIDASAKKGKTYAYTVRAYSGSYKSAYNTKGLSVKDKY